MDDSICDQIVDHAGHRVAIGFNQQWTCNGFAPVT